MRVPLLDHRLVVLKHFQFTYKAFALLLSIQQEAPNLLLEIEQTEYPTRADELHKFVPAHSLCLEDFRALRTINA